MFEKLDTKKVFSMATIVIAGALAVVNEIVNQKKEERINNLENRIIELETKEN